MHGTVQLLLSLESAVYLFIYLLTIFVYPKLALAYSHDSSYALHFVKLVNKFKTFI